MKNKILTFFLILILVLIIFFLWNLIFNKNKITSAVENMTVLPGSKASVKNTPTPTPIKFQFNKTTNLQQELDSINPEVLDSDFNVLKTTISKL